MSVRAKFRCESKSDGETVLLSLKAVNRGDADGPSDLGNPASAEDSIFGRYTPYGSLSMGIRNLAASDQFEVGKSYYLDFTPADE